MRESLERLERWLRDNGAPAWSEVALVELSSESRFALEGAGLRVPKSALQTVAAYEPRFDELLDRGYAWINLNGYGALGATLVVLVELPRERGAVPRERVSVNLSGPYLSAPWDASDRIVLEE